MMVEDGLVWLIFPQDTIFILGFGFFGVHFNPQINVFVLFISFNKDILNKYYKLLLSISKFGSKIS